MESTKDRSVDELIEEIKALGNQVCGELGKLYPEGGFPVYLLYIEPNKVVLRYSMGQPSSQGAAEIRITTEELDALEQSLNNLSEANRESQEMIKALWVGLGNDLADLPQTVPLD